MFQFYNFTILINSISVLNFMKTAKRLKTKMSDYKLFLQFRQAMTYS